MDIEIKNLSNAAATGNVAKNPTAPPPKEAQSGSGTSVSVKAGAGESLSVEQVKQVVSEVQSRINVVNNSLNLEIDDKTGTVVVKIIDNETGDVIRQIPSEELLAIRERMDELVGVLFNAQT